MQVIFWTEDNLCFISDCKNSFNCKLKKFINKQIIIFYSPSNALCLSEKSVKYHTVKQLNIIFSLVCVPIPPSQICKYWISVNKDARSLKNIHREKTLKQNSNAFQKYEYGHLSRKYIISTLCTSFLNWNKIFERIK